MRNTSHREPIDIGEMIRNAVILNPKNWPLGEEPVGEGFDSLDRLFGLLEKREVRHVLAGGVASLFYVDGRSPQSLELLMEEVSLKNVPEIHIMNRSRGRTQGRFEKLNIEFSHLGPLIGLVRERHVIIRAFGPRKVPCLDVYGLLLVNLFALPSLYRQWDFSRVVLCENDLAMLLTHYAVSTEEVLAEITAYLSPAEVGELRGMVAEIQDRTSRRTARVKGSFGH